VHAVIPSANTRTSKYPSDTCSPATWPTAETRTGPGLMSNAA
jgi:hypothetical protein